MRRAAIAVAAALSLALVGLGAAPAQAADGSVFQPGNIISDENFYNPGAMSPDAIQAFLNARVPSCAAGYTCLRDYVTATGDRPFVANRCNGYVASPAESAAVIIWRVAQSCGINPQVLLVTLQKEQGLVTSTAPSATRYRIAMGYACPDTAACDTRYYGFFNQVYQAAYQFKIYRGVPGNFNFQAGRYNTIPWHPNAACGSSSVYIYNQATAGLYNYTPYRPNAAALANVYATGDGCSSYGNRNFFAYYTDWFGNPAADLHTPRSTLDSVTGGMGEIVVSGWAYDPDALTAPVDVHVYVDGAGAAVLTANGSRPDVGAAFPGVGNSHGFLASVPLGGGDHSVCLYGINIGAGGSNSLIGCRTVTVQEASPVGQLQTIAAAPGTGLRVSGWALDPEASTAIAVHVYVDGAFATAGSAGASTASVPPQYASLGTAHGFAIDVPATAGTHLVCAYGINVGKGSNRLLGCGTATRFAGSPLGSVDGVSTAPGAQSVSGWVFDPDTADSITAHVYVDGRFVGAVPATGARSDLASSFPGYGAAHGFGMPLTLAPGAHTVCAYGINVGAGGNSLVGCRAVTVRSGSPAGALDWASGTAGGVSVGGWALDWDTRDPITVHAYVDGVFATSFIAGGSRPDIAAAFPGYGDLHGYTATVPTAPGPHSVCLYGINVGAGGSSLLGCRGIVAG